MGKKKNKNKYYSSTPEQTILSLETIDDIINGKISPANASIMDIVDIDDHKIIEKNGLSKELNDAIIYDREKKIKEKKTIKTEVTGKINTDDDDSFNDYDDIDVDVTEDNDAEDEEYAIAYSDVESDVEDGDIDDEDSDSELTDEIEEDDEDEYEYEDDDDDTPFCHRITQFIYIPDLLRVMINDNIAPTSIDLHYCLNTKKNDIEGIFDPADAMDRMQEMIDYILTLKHPTAIFEEDEFNEIDAFNNVRSYHNDIFRFYKYKNYIFCYYLDRDTFEDFYTIFDNLEPNGILKLMINMSYECGNLNTAFFCDDSYIESLYESEDLNAQEEFIEVYKYFNEDEKGIASLDTIPLLTDIQEEVRDMIDELQGLDDEDEEDWDEEEDDTDDDEEREEMDEVSEEVSENEDIAEDLLNEEMESVDDDDLVVDVHRKSDDN